ncbi:MAG: patatin-like phospholipase family protein [Proteobacteria bacterium]|nr:patatin-like phospholipase family protein [Pseudomonadota bacterium]
MDVASESVRLPGLRPTLALVLTGGGSRAAYQVGVLKALTELVPRTRNPFQIIVGTSAGAVAASVLAAEAHQWRRAVAGLIEVWANFRSSQVFQVDAPHMLRAGAHWVLSLLSGGLLLAPPKAILDNTPLRQLLTARIDFDGIGRSIARGHLRAVALCSTSYSVGTSVAFYDGVDAIADWSRVQRIGQRCRLSLDHLMASAAVPLLFTPVPIGNDYFGDGAMRQQHPLSPAVHLGADRVLVIGVRARDAGLAVDRRHTGMPTPGEIFGYMLDTLITDQVYADLEQLDRINALIHAAPAAVQGERTVDTLMLAPSVDPRTLAAPHTQEMPPGLRALLRVIGGRDAADSQLASYLMFEAGYTRALIDLGYSDAMEARDILRAFVNGEPLPETVRGVAIAQAS